MKKLLIISLSLFVLGCGGGGIGTGIETGTETGTETETETETGTLRPLNERFEVYDVALSGTADNGVTRTSTIHSAARPGGGLTLGWNEFDQGHLLRLDADMKPDLTSQGGEWELDGLMIAGTLGLEDDGMAVLAFDYTSSLTSTLIDHHLRLFIYDAEGNKTRETSIIGGTGIGVGSLWFDWSSNRNVAMVAHEGRIAIFTKVSEHRNESVGIHQGDLYIEVDEDGNIDESTRDHWSTSHSNLLHLVLEEDGENHRLTVGDGGPFGIVYQIQSQYYSDNTVVWPPEDQWEVGEDEGISTVSAGTLCGFQLRDGYFFATLGSVREHPNDPSVDNGDILLLNWPIGITQGDPVNTTWLTETPDVAEVCPSLVDIGDENQLIVWGTRDGTTATLALVDGEGTLIDGPTASDAPYHKYSLPIRMSDSSVAWAYAESSATSVKVVMVSTD